MGITFPLSPIMYILVAEALRRRIDKEKRLGIILGIRIVRGTKRINHSQFFDDTLLLGRASNIIASYLKGTMEIFMTASKGLINYDKIQLYSWNINAISTTTIAIILHFPFDKNWHSFKYLGIHVCLHSLWITWHHILAKIKTKFLQWSGQWLNPMGRVVLLKYVLSSLRIFQFLSLLAPVNVKLAIAQDL
jgi:hypothetical protein